MQRRTPRWLAATIGLALLTAAACDDSNEDGGASAGSSGQQVAGAGQSAAGTAGQPAAGAAGQGQSGTSGQSGGTGGSADDPANYTGPLVAVDTSTLDKSYPDQTCKHQLRLARIGQEAAALYSDTGKVWLQFMSVKGKLIHEPIALGDAPTDGKLAGDVLPPHVSLVSDDTSYVACWDTGVTSLSLDKATVSCARVSAATGAVTALFTESGSRPSLARRDEGVALVTRHPEHLSVRYLDPTSAVAPFEVPVAAAQSHGEPSDVLLTATESGFAMVNLSDGTLQRLDPSLEAVGAPQPLAHTGWFVTTPQLVAVGDTVALGSPDPYAFRLTLAAPGQPVVKVSFDGGSKEGMNAALTSDASSVGVFAPVTTLDGPALIFHAVDPSHPPATTVYARVASGGWDNWGEECSFAAVPVDGATLVAVPALHGVKVVRFPQP